MDKTNEHETTDVIIREMRRIKEDLARSTDFNIDRILENAREKQKQSGREILSPPSREAR